VEEGKGMIPFSFLLNIVAIGASCIYWPAGHGWSLFFWCFMVFILWAIWVGNFLEKRDKRYEAGLTDPQEHGDPLKQDVEVKP
jgi:hypothetical protein